MSPRCARARAPSQVIGHSRCGSDLRLSLRGSWPRPKPRTSEQPRHSVFSTSVARSERIHQINSLAMRRGSSPIGWAVGRRFRIGPRGQTSTYGDGA